MNLSRIVFPGYVKNTEKAISMLGGSKEIYTQCSSKSPSFKIVFRPNDPLAHSIESTTKVDPCVVLRIKVVRHYKMVDGIKKFVKHELSGSVLASSNQSSCFQKPSDFQFLPSLGSTLNEPTIWTNPPPEQNFLYLPPPVFIHNYNYDAMYIQKRIFSSKQHESVKLWKKDDCSWIVNQSDLHSLENGPKPPPIAPDVVRELVEVFEEMFENRPIWTTIAIFDHLLEVQEKRGDILELSQQSAQVFHCLACVAYHIKNGPFQMCWVRYGINPILTNSYCIMQSFILSLREWQYADQIIQSSRKTNSRYVNKKISSLPCGISKITALPERLLYGVQLIDLSDKFVCELLQDQSDNFSFTSGWFPQNVIDTVRKFCLLKLQRMILDKKNTPPSLIMADIVSADQITKELEVYKTKSTAVDSFDFEFLNQASSILETYESGNAESISDLLEIITSKTCALSFDRAFSY